VEQTCNIGNYVIAKFKLAAAAILDFKILIPFLKYYIDLHQIWSEYYDIMHEEHISNIGSYVIPKSKMATAAILDFKKLMPFVKEFDYSSPNLEGMLEHKM